MIKFLCWIKVNAIALKLQYLNVDMEISHEEFTAIFKEKDKYKKMKENVRNVKKNPQNMRLNSVN